MKLQLRHLWIAVVLPLVVTACGPSEKEKAQRAEQRRIDCLDKICQGETSPRNPSLSETALKINGNWYFAPKEYFGINTAVFYWPSRAPGFRGGDYPEKGQPFYDAAIEIFLTGRHRWPTPNVEKPWESKSWQQRFEELQSQGLSMKRTQATPELDIVRFYEANGKLHRYTYYVAKTQKRIRGEGPPVLSCYVTDPPRSDDFCTSGEFWQPDVHADFRFSARHANDWPAIHEEIIRVLNLLKKA
jgi:hypothetical protein